MEPYGDKFSGKPPSGKGGMKEYTIPKKSKIESLPPRFKKKFLIENGFAPPPEPATGTSADWDGSTVTFSVSLRKI